MRIPWSDDRSAYGQIVIPIAVISNGEGPTALLTGGVHGDEYEGQIVLGALARDLDPAIRGRIIIMPCANPAAALAGRRHVACRSGNLARLFPGDPAGGPTGQIAEGITRLLLPEADFLVDFHSGGSTLDYLPCAFGRLPSDCRSRHACSISCWPSARPSPRSCVGPRREARSSRRRSTGHRRDGNGTRRWRRCERRYARDCQARPDANARPYGHCRGQRGAPGFTPAGDRKQSFRTLTWTGPVRAGFHARRPCGGWRPCWSPEHRRET